MDTSQAGATVAAVGAMEYGSHCCFVCADDDVTRLAVHSYIRDGLSSNDRVMCLLGHRGRQWLLGVLSDGPTRPEQHLEDGSLVIVSPGETPLWEGDFSPDSMAETFFDAVDLAVRDGYEGLRVCGDMTWGRESGVSHADLLEFERLADAGIPGRRVMGFCLYDPREFSGVQIDDQERLHPLTAGTGRVRPPTLQALATARGLRLIGEADVATLTLLEESLRTVTGRAGGDVVVDMSALEFADISAVEAIHRAAIGLGPGRRLVMRRAAPTVRKVLDLFGWNTGIVHEDRPSGECSDRLEP